MDFYGLSRDSSPLPCVQSVVGSPDVDLGDRFPVAGMERILKDFNDKGPASHG